MSMSLLGGSQILTGAAILALSVFVMWFFRAVPLGDTDKRPSFLRLTVIPMFILLLAVSGFALMFRGAGFI
jgi:hypothetical protein